MPGDREPVYSITVAARLAGLHPQTLRKYERAGLLKPARQAGNRRTYSDADVRRLRRIQYLVEGRGLNVAGLAMTLAIADRLETVSPEASADELRVAIDEATRPSRDPA